MVSIAEFHVSDGGAYLWSDKRTFHETSLAIDVGRRHYLIVRIITNPSCISKGLPIDDVA
jgi:hypothetical protein